jgi:hypothetical protein
MVVTVLAAEVAPGMALLQLAEEACVERAALQIPELQEMRDLIPGLERAIASKAAIFTTGLGNDNRAFVLLLSLDRLLCFHG